MPGPQAPLKAKATRAGKPGGRLDLTACLLTKFEPAASDTGLLADAQLLDNLFVSFGVAPLQILQVALAPAHHVQQTTPRSVVFPVSSKVDRKSVV